MHQQREDIDILFRKTMPEAILEDIRTHGSLLGEPFIMSGSGSYSEAAYEHFSKLNLQEYSPDEVRIRYRALSNSMEKESVFGILPEYADHVLTEKEDRPLCAIEESLNWNSITLRLGQDLFTTAWLAWRDVRRGRGEFERKNFSWPAIIETDDTRLNNILKKGLAENHFHLHGSTQSFSLSWACLMNHPDYISHFLEHEEHFRENLNPNISSGIRDNVMSWEDRLLYAAMIRALLFEKLLVHSDALREFRSFDRMVGVFRVKKKTEMLRFEYGEKFKQPDHGYKCLDYAVCRECCRVGRPDHNRLLTGERNFLYHCFYMQYGGKFSWQESLLFYLYLVIKSNFRSELIQNNHRPGFGNFAAYQDRKNQFFGAFDEYWAEAQRLSVCGGIEENNIVSLEARIMPKDSASDMRREISRLDSLVSFADAEKRKDLYYVIHFAKSSFQEAEFDKKKNRGLLIPRNVKTRKSIKGKALALCSYLNNYDSKDRRVWGIDACSNEIGCRPETFATEFRYLRFCTTGKLGLTYHVGEDFLDIADGLRAIDEVLYFLPVQKGDRLGHSLALGVDPKDYYTYKRNSIYLPKQDYLDNLVWLLHRSLDMNVNVELNKRTWMINRAGELIHDIYQDKLTRRQQTEDIIEIYYKSWLMRGDHPDLYRSGQYRKAERMNWFPYRRYMQTDRLTDHDRKNEAAAEFYYLYHFDPDVKKEGCRPVSFDIEPWWIEMVQEIQRVMRIEVYKRGIAIECNPTSNVLIGTFKRYDKHPITVFNNYHLVHDDEPNILVSVNTDDLGVFDTSLKNEYALLFASIARSRHKDKNYEDDDIYEYINYLRQNGIDMAFRQVREDYS